MICMICNLRYYSIEVVVYVKHSRRIYKRNICAYCKENLTVLSLLKEYYHVVGFDDSTTNNWNLA